MARLETPRSPPLLGNGYHYFGTSIHISYLQGSPNLIFVMQWGPGSFVSLFITHCCFLSPCIDVMPSILRQDRHGPLRVDLQAMQAKRKSHRLGSQKSIMHTTDAKFRAIVSSFILPGAINFRD